MPAKNTSPRQKAQRPFLRTPSDLSSELGWIWGTRSKLWMLTTWGANKCCHGGRAKNEDIALMTWAIYIIAALIQWMLLRGLRARACVQRFCAKSVANRRATRTRVSYTMLGLVLVCRQP